MKRILTIFSIGGVFAIALALVRFEHSKVEKLVVKIDALKSDQHFELAVSMGRL